jgi:hypothetical protein
MQLGKLGCSSRDQRPRCKTDNSRPQWDQWATGEKQNFPIVVQRDDGRFQIGLSDEGPSFETRQFAAVVAAKGGHKLTMNLA